MNEINVHTYTHVIRHCSPYSHCCIDWLFAEKKLFNQDRCRISDLQTLNGDHSEQIIKKKHDIFKIICKFALMPGKIKLILLKSSPKNIWYDEIDIFSAFIIVVNI